MFGYSPLLPRLGSQLKFDLGKQCQLKSCSKESTIFLKFEMNLQDPFCLLILNHLY